MRIGELAARTGLTTKTIRYYEDIGIMPAPSRAANGYRDYRPEAVDRLEFVRDAQASGLSLAEIASVLELRGQGRATCHHVVDLLGRHLVEMDRRIEAMQASRDAYAEMIERARTLDPAECTDPERCQTIAAGQTSGAVAHDHHEPHWGHAQHA